MRIKKKELKELIQHCWVHSGYPDCGYRQMDERRRKVYNKVIGRSKLEAMIANEEIFLPRKKG